MDHELHTPDDGELSVDTSDMDTTILEGLFTDLDFEETPALAEERIAILAMIAEGTDDPAQKEAAWIKYDKVGETLVDTTVDHLDIKKREKLHIALIIHKALLFREAQNVERYIEELEWAYTYADRTGLHEIADGIDTALDEVARRLRGS